MTKWKNRVFHKFVADLFFSEVLLAFELRVIFMLSDFHFSKCCGGFCMRRILVMIFLLSSLFVGIVMLETYPVTTFTTSIVGSALRVNISERGHFFGEDFSLTITSNVALAEIFYTLDGSTPTIESERYVEPIPFAVGGEVEAVVLRAIATWNEETSVPFTHTFFLGENVDERFDTLVFSLSTDNENLYGHELGIFVEGLIREEYLLENPGTTVNAFTPANFTQRGREFERPIHMEVFNPGGRLAFSQAAGMRVTGDESVRDTQVQSVRIIARREYSPQARRFEHRFFPGDVAHDARARNISAYDNIVLRNGAQDRNHGVLRHELSSVLARRAGFIDVTPVRAASMFINGNYYGHMWLQTRIDDDYLRALYNAPTNNFDVIRGEWEFRDATPEQEEALNTMNLFAFSDLTNNADFARLEEIADVENLLRYYAFQIWLGNDGMNNDHWLRENMHRWRYAGEPVSGMPALDRRWRFAMSGLDQTFGHIGGDYTRPTLHNLLSTDNFDGALLAAILQRDDMAERFAEIFRELMEEALNYETVSEVLEELYEQIQNELDFSIAAGLLDSGVTRETIAEHHASTLLFAQNRHIYIWESLEELLFSENEGENGEEESND
jgi:hypothetical protein